MVMRLLLPLASLVAAAASTPPGTNASVAALFDSSAGGAESSVYEAPRWGAFSVLACLGAVLLLLVPAILCWAEPVAEGKAFHLCSHSTVRVLPGSLGAQYSELQAEDAHDEDSPITREVAGEVLLAMACPFAAAAVVGLVGLGLGPVFASLTGLVLTGIFALRGLLRDVELTVRCKGQGIGSMSWGEYGLLAVTLFASKLELTDAISDGSALAVVALREATNPYFHRRAVFAWAESNAVVGGLAPAVNTFGLAGCQAFCLMVAMLTQLGAASFPGKAQTSVRADLAGLGALSEAAAPADDPEGSKENKRFLLLFSRLLGENLTQLLWQTSALMALGGPLSSQPLVAASLVSSLLSTAKDGVGLVRLGCSSGAAIRYFAVVGGGLAILVSALFAVKLVMTDVCEDHAWRAAWPPASGCIEMPGDLGGKR